MKIKQKSYVKLEPKSRDPYLRRTDGEMIKIVKEIESGLISIRTACFKYGLCRNTLKLFITKFSIRTLGDEFSNQMCKVFLGRYSKFPKSGKKISV